MMKKQSPPSILSSAQRDLWRAADSAIWTFDADHLQRDPALSVLQTLLDQPRWLEAHHLYDETGSELFETICELPEYYLTRTESAILAQKAEEIIRVAQVDCIVELGAGTSQKTLYLLKEQTRQRRGGAFAPIDVSLSSLKVARDTVKKQFPRLTFHGLHGKYQDGIAGIDKDLPTLFVFLGSTVGNFNRSEFVGFFQHLSDSMGPKDFFLLGVDRVKKRELLEKAYNDAQGVTAKFILNVFANVNRLTGGNFDSEKMRYHSWYNPEGQQIEMYAVSTAAQEIRFPSHGVSFSWPKDDRILVEISRKFAPARLQQQLRCFGLKPVAHFTDPKEWFSLLLFQKMSS